LKANELTIKQVENDLGEKLGPAVRWFAYYEIFELNTWGGYLPFALLGFKNKVGLLQALLWFFCSPPIRMLLRRALKLSRKLHTRAKEAFVAEFDTASKSRKFTLLS